jgi:hypothetical protein
MSITVAPPISGNALSLYKYEPFAYTFTHSTSSVLQFTASSSELQAFCSIVGPSVVFAGTFQTSYTSALSLVIRAADGTSLTISVTVGPGRFFPPAANQNFQLFQYENISNTFGSNIVFTAPISLTTVLSAPSLPSGLSFGGSSTSWFIQGKPVLQIAQSNYQVIGSNSTNGKIVTTIVSLKVNPQIVRVSPSTATQSGLVVGTAITPVTFTAIQPETIYLNTFRYTSTGLPDGFSFEDISGSPFPASGIPPDPALTIVLVGTPSLAFATAQSTSGGNVYQTRLTGSQTDQTGRQTSGSSLIEFSFAETVLITASNPVPLYQTKPLGSGDVVITAGSFFPSSTISNVTASALPPGLSLVSITSSNYRLTGTPTVVDLASVYTFTATNSNGTSRSVSLTLPVNPDIVTFGGVTPTPGSNVQFIVSRDLANAKTGYYTTPIQFVATSTANATPIVYSSSIDLSLYGLTLNSTTGSLTGIPTSPLALTSLVVSATDSLGTVQTTTINLTILADQFVFPTYAPEYFQNRPITPFQFVMVSTLSDRPIQSYSSTNLPAGLFLSTGGILTGTTTVGVGGTFTIIATTGYSTITSAPYTYTVQADNLLILQVDASNTVAPLFSNVQFQTLQYATDSIVNPVYSITSYPAEFPSPVLALTSAGFLSGDFTQGPVFPTYALTASAASSGVTSTSPIIITFTNPTTELLIAGYTNAGVGTISNDGYVGTTTDYVFSATSTGTQQVNSQVWSGALPYTGSLADGHRYPDLAQDQGAFMAMNVSNIYDGVYNPTTNAVDWTSTDPQVAVVALSLPVYIGRYLNIASDGAGHWVALQSAAPSHPADARVFMRTGTGAWTVSSNEISNLVNSGSDTTLTYIGGRYVLGQTSNLGDPNSYSVLVADPSMVWAPATTLPTMTKVLRFATSNTTIVAVGSLATAGGPISYSTDNGSNWTSPSVPSFMTGSNVVLYDILYAANTWVTCGLDSNGSNMIAYSPTLSNWAQYTVDSNVLWSGIAFNGNAWTIAGNRVVSGSNQSTILSLDATPWPTQAVSLGPLTGVIQFGSTGTPLFSRILSTAITSSSPSVGSVFIPPGPLTFTQPSQPTFVLYQYVPYTFPVVATGSASFIFYYAPNLPIGFQFNLSPTGVSASLSGTSPSNTSSSITLYAKTANSSAVSLRVGFNTIIPYFVNPQSGAGAYTAQLRNSVEANAAQNARDNTVFPEVNPLPGPFMGPRAPDVVTELNCLQKLCKKPCPNCHTMM